MKLFFCFDSFSVNKFPRKKLFKKKKNLKHFKTLMLNDEIGNIRLGYNRFKLYMWIL